MDPIEQGLSQIAVQIKALTQPRAYFNGDHDLTFATAKFLNAFGPYVRASKVNLCERIVLTRTDRLHVSGFGVRDATEAATTDSTLSETEQVAECIEDCLEAVHFDALQEDANTGAFVDGKAFLIGWVTPAGAPVLQFADSGTTTVITDPEVPGLRTAAVRAWVFGKKYRVNLYEAGRIEKYITKSNSGQLPVRRTQLEPFVDENGQSTITHGYPLTVWELDNKRSELRDVIPVQDTLNKAVCDEVVAREYYAMPQRWATGIQQRTDPVTGKTVQGLKSFPGGVWDAPGEGAKFGDFKAGDIEKILASQETIQNNMARVSGTPPRVLGLEATAATSGEQVKIEERSLTARIISRQRRWGPEYASAMSFCVLVMLGREVSLRCEWDDPAPLSEHEKLENAGLALIAGVPLQDRLEGLGFAPDDVTRIMALAATEAQQQTAGSNAMRAQVLSEFRAGQAAAADQVPADQAA